MTQSEYDALTRACDALLTSPRASPDTVALDWLHVLSEHPHNLAQYDALFGRESNRARATRGLRHRAGRYLALAR